MTILDNEQVKKKCQRFTPDETVIEMFEMAGFSSPRDIIGKKFLDNSFGTGNILAEAVERYIKACEQLGLLPSDISEMLQRDIYGIELDEQLYSLCFARLDAIANKYHLPKVRWNLIHADALKWETNGKFDYIVGNPPYVAYREIDDENRKYLRENYKSCGRGKFDYCYAFIEKAIDLLSERGVLVQLVPNNIYKNVFAEDLRNMLRPHITRIDIFPAQKLFKDVLTSTSIFVYERSSQNEEVLCKDITSKRDYRIKRDSLIGKWMFREQAVNCRATCRFGDYFNASSSVATLLNEAFIITQSDKVSLNIEETLLRPAVSPKSKHLKRTEYIIFPYFYEEGRLCRIKPEIFEKKYPRATDYLKQFHDKLNARKADKNAQWYEYGRSQALQHLNQEKLLLSTVVTNTVEVYRIGAQEIPYTGIYIVPTKDKSIDLAEKVLKSKRFMDYIKEIGISVNGKSVRITCGDINNYEFEMEDPAWKN